jgi:hypothetical protein
VVCRWCDRNFFVEIEDNEAERGDFGCADVLQSNFS